jgi:hypothetical protein
MLGFGPRLNTVFASRWKALLWSAGMLLTAYCSIPDREPNAAAAPDAAAPPTHARSPWAKG